MMKQLAFLFYALALASAQADTNFIAVLTTADGISYTNAHIDHTTPIDADVWYDGGIVHIALTNLPPTLQKIYPYDTNTAAQFLAAEKQKLKEKQIAAQAQAAARQAWLEQSAKNAGWIYVVDCKKDCNPYIYTAYINKNYQQICLNNAPNKIINPPHVGRALLESMQALNFNTKNKLGIESVVRQNFRERRRRFNNFIFSFSL
ncbi:MAG: hypothetical protein ABR955_15855 [Verrucomicrobiota bacterium]